MTSKYQYLPAARVCCRYFTPFTAMKSMLITTAGAVDTPIATRTVRIIQRERSRVKYRKLENAMSSANNRIDIQDPLIS